MLGAALLTGVAHAAPQPLDSVVAIVDNDVVMKSQLDQRVREVEQTIAKRGGGMPPPGALDQQVLERLIVENLKDWFDGKLPPTPIPETPVKSR